eukprot:1818249-Amphidinium_carterae.1
MELQLLYARKRPKLCRVALDPTAQASELTHEGSFLKWVVVGVIGNVRLSRLVLYIGLKKSTASSHANGKKQNHEEENIKTFH